MVEYILYDRDPDGYNGTWIDSVDRTYNNITMRSILKNCKYLIEKNNCPYGQYNLDILKGPKSIIQDSEFYECCIGYANINYEANSITCMETNII